MGCQFPKTQGYLHPDLLLEERVLVFRVLESILLECLVTDQGIIGADNRVKLEWISASQKLTHGSIMSVPVFLSSNCFGPFHFFHTHLQR